jgi:hypothetical protein
MNEGVDERLLQALQQANNLDLYRLSGVIERLLADPRRIIAVRRHLHLGQAVRYVDWRNGSLREGQLIALHETQALVRDRLDGRQWKLPYAAIEPPEPGAAQAPAEPPQRAAPVPTRNDFRCGEKVAFEDKYLNTVVGKIVRINDRTASIDPGDGTKWRVGFALLRHVVDI